MERKSMVLVSLSFLLFIDSLSLGVVIPVFAPLFTDVHSNLLPTQTSIGTRNFLYSIALVIPMVSMLFGAIYIQIFWHESPCPLCLLQRLSLIGVFIGFLMNYWFGISSRHYSIALLSAVFGGAVGLRQIALHLVPGSPPFGDPVFGLHLYTWSFLVHVALVLLICALLFLDGSISEYYHRPYITAKKQE